MLDPKLNTFLKVVELGSYTAAAGALHLTQPAVSQHIQKLEENYGCQFFTMEGRAIRLTQNGKRFLHYARMQQSNEAQLIRQLQSNHKPLRLGSTLSIADYYLPSLLAGHAGRQNSTLQVKVANTGALLNLLLQCELDAAFIEGIFDRSLFEAEVFENARFVPIAAANHPLAGRRVTLAALHPYPLILREPGSGTRAILESFLAQQNDTVDSFAKLWEVGSFLLIKQLLEESSALSFMYEAVAAKEVAQKRLVQLEVQNFRVAHPLHYVYLKNSVEKENITHFYTGCRFGTVSSSL